jgi:hypothetical protein
MFRPHRVQAALIAFLAVALLTPPASQAQASSDRDTREISSYVLTDAAFAKYTQATRNLSAAAKQMPSDCDDATGAKSLDDYVARVNAIPEARAAISAAGMTTREYVVFGWSVLQSGMAAWALDQPGGTLPAGTSMANVNFYRANAAAMQKLGAETKSDACDDADSEEEEEEVEP